MLAKAPNARSVSHSRLPVNRERDGVRKRCSSRLNVVTDKRLTMGARVLYCLLDDYAGVKAECWPYQTTAAERLGRSVRSVKRWIAELVRHGYITIRRTQSGNRYRLTWAAVPENNAQEQFGPSQVPTRARVYNELDQELAVGNNNSIDGLDSEAWEFGLDDAVGLFNWASEGSGGER